MKLSLTEFSTFLEKKWFEKSGLITAIVAAWLLEPPLLAKVGAPAWAYLIVLPFSSIVIYALWRGCRRIPKTKKGRIGFVVSIYCSDDKENEQVKEDFIVPLRQLVRSGNIGDDFQFIELPQHLAQHINDPSDAEKLRQKSRAHFVLYGRVRLRVIAGKPHHIIEFEGAVTHKEISPHNQRNLAKEFNELLPRRVQIPTENDLFSFKITSEWADVVARYVMGIAAYVSGDLVYAEALYQDVEHRLRHKDKTIPAYTKLAQRLPIRFAEISFTKAQWAYNKWRETHDNKLIDEMGLHLDQISNALGSLPSVISLTAIHAFLSARNVDTAVRCMAHLKKAAPDTWHLNMAFLRGYAGDLRSATRHYRSASNMLTDARQLAEVEDFMCWVVEIEPKCFQLFYCLGYFNWKIKGDFVQAKNDFESFLSGCNPDSFPHEQQNVGRWLDEISKQII